MYLDVNEKQFPNIKKRILNAGLELNLENMGRKMDDYFYNCKEREF